jgi:hypothetical protein
MRFEGSEYGGLSWVVRLGLRCGFVLVWWRVVVRLGGMDCESVNGLDGLRGGCGYCCEKVFGYCVA